MAMSTKTSPKGSSGGRSTTSATSKSAASGASNPQNEAGAFVEAYDKRCGEHPSKYDAGWRAVADERDRTREPRTLNSLPEFSPAVPYSPSSSG